MPATLHIVPVGRIASHVELYGMPNDSDANRVLQTGITQLDVEFYGVSNESLDLRHDDFFRFIERDALVSRGA